jgi:hypothetical protein
MSGVVKVPSLLNNKKKVVKSKKATEESKSVEDLLTEIQQKNVQKEQEIKKATKEIEEKYQKSISEALSSLKKNSSVQLKIEPFEDWEKTILKDVRDDTLESLLFIVGQMFGEYQEYYIIPSKDDKKEKCYSIWVEDHHQIIRKFLINKIHKSKAQKCCSFCQSVFHRFNQCPDLKEERKSICPTCNKKGHTAYRCLMASKDAEAANPDAEDDDQIDPKKE